MSTSRLVVLTAGAALALSGAAWATNWSSVFPPLTVADVEKLGAAADQLEAAEGDATDGTVGWDNPESGTHGTVQVVKRFERDGLECVRYRLFIKARRYEPFFGTPIMCKVDGTWKFAN